MGELYDPSPSPTKMDKHFFPTQFEVEDEEQQEEGGDVDRGLRASASAMTDPCSNDNAGWLEAIQPCSTNLALVFENIIEDSSDVVDEINDSRDVNETVIVEQDNTTENSTSLAGIFVAYPNDTVEEMNNSRDVNETVVVEPDITDDNAVLTTEKANSCTEFVKGSSPSGSSTSNTVQFSYDVYTPTSVDEKGFVSILAIFERQLGNGVASTLGVLDCSESTMSLQIARNTPPGTRSLKQTLALSSPDRLISVNEIVGVSARPDDTFELECTTVDDNNESNCFPIAGSMTAWMSTTDRSHLRQLNSTDSKGLLLEAVRAYIEQNQALYLNEDIRLVKYVGKRDLETEEPSPTLVDTGPTTGDGSGTNQSNPNLANGAAESQVKGNMIHIGISVVCVGLIMLIIGAVYVRRRRRRQRRRKSIDHDLENGSKHSRPESESSELFIDLEETTEPCPEDTHQLVAIGAASHIVQHLNVYARESPACAHPKDGQDCSLLEESLTKSPNSPRMSVDYSSDDLGTQPMFPVLGAVVSPPTAPTPSFDTVPSDDSGFIGNVTAEESGRSTTAAEREFAVLPITNTIELERGGEDHKNAGENELDDNSSVAATEYDEGEWCR